MAPGAGSDGDEVLALRLRVAELETANMLMSTQMNALQEELDRLKKERTPKVLSPAKRDMASGSESAARKYAHRQHALHDAARDGDVGAIQYIAQHLDEFDYKSLDDVNEDDAGKPGHLAWAPLHVAVAHGSDEAMLQALCSAGADVNALKADGQTPLDYAIMRNAAAAARLLRSQYAATCSFNSRRYADRFVDLTGSPYQSS